MLPLKPELIFRSKKKGWDTQNLTASAKHYASEETQNHHQWRREGRGLVGAGRTELDGVFPATWFKWRDVMQIVDKPLEAGAQVPALFTADTGEASGTYRALPRLGVKWEDGLPSVPRLTEITCRLNHAKLVSEVTNGQIPATSFGWTELMRVFCKTLKCYEMTAVPELPLHGLRENLGCKQEVLCMVARWRRSPGSTLNLGPRYSRCYSARCVLRL